MQADLLFSLIKLYFPFFVVPKAPPYCITMCTDDTSNVIFEGDWITWKGMKLCIECFDLTDEWDIFLKERICYRWDQFLLQTPFQQKACCTGKLIVTEVDSLEKVTRNQLSETIPLHQFPFFFSQSQMSIFYPINYHQNIIRVLRWKPSSKITLETCSKKRFHKCIKGSDLP